MKFNFRCSEFRIDLPLESALQSVFKEISGDLDEIARRLNIRLKKNPSDKKAKKALSYEGIKLCKRRATDIETVFGDVKRN